MADESACKINVKVSLTKLRRFFPRPCDDGRKPAWAWCVEEVEFKPDMSVRWTSTLYEPVFVRAFQNDTSPKFTHMTKDQAKREARLQQWSYDKCGKGIPKKRGWRGSK